MLYLDHGKSVQSMAFASDGRTLATANGEVQLWDLVSGQVRRTLHPGDTSKASAVAYSPDGTTLAVGCGLSLRWTEEHDRPLSQGMVNHFALTFWDAAGDYRQAKSLALRSAGFVAFAPDGRTLAVGDGDVIRLLSFPEIRPRENVSTRYGAIRFFFSPDGNWLAVVGASGMTHVVPTSNWRPHLYVNTAIQRVAFHPDGRTLAVGLTEPGEIYLCDVWTRQMHTRFREPKLHFQSLAFSPDGRFLAATHDDQVCFWDVHRKAVHTVYDWKLGNLEHLLFSPDGTTAAASSKHGIVVWDVDR
jgi:WD40 repeat protein